MLFKIQYSKGTEWKKNTSKKWFSFKDILFDIHFEMNEKKSEEEIIKKRNYMQSEQPFQLPTDD